MYCFNRAKYQKLQDNPYVLVWTEIWGLYQWCSKLQIQLIHTAILRKVVGKICACHNPER